MYTKNAEAVFSVSPASPIHGSVHQLVMRPRHQTVCCTTIGRTAFVPNEPSPISEHLHGPAAVPSGRPI